jgi:hypothetical protein
LEAAIAAAEASIPKLQHQQQTLGEQKAAEESKLEGLFEALKERTGNLRGQV